MILQMMTPEAFRALPIKDGVRICPGNTNYTLVGDITEPANFGDNVIIGGTPRQPAMLGDRVAVGNNVYLVNVTRIGKEFTMGDNGHICGGTVLGEGAVIGNRNLIGPHCVFEGLANFDSFNIIKAGMTAKDQFYAQKGNTFHAPVWESYTILGPYTKVVGRASFGYKAAVRSYGLFLGRVITLKNAQVTFEDGVQFEGGTTFKGKVKVVNAIMRRRPSKTERQRWQRHLSGTYISI